MQILMTFQPKINANPENAYEYKQPANYNRRVCISAKIKLFP